MGGFKIGDNNRVEWSPPRAFLAFKVGELGPNCFYEVLSYLTRADLVETLSVFNHTHGHVPVISWLQVGGNTGEAVVLVEGKRTGFRTELTYLRVDTPSSALLLKGTSERHERLEDWAGAVEFRRKMLP